MMRKLLYKELHLSASKLTFLFIAFGLMTLIPGYPILVGSFFICFGIFQTVQQNREANDILYSALLPVAKADVVRSKYIFALFIQMCGFLLMVIMTVLRMTVLAELPPYANNALMPANPVFLGFALLIYGCFNDVFLGGFFKTAYSYTRPFIWFMVICFPLIGIGEALGHIPVLEFLHSIRAEDLGMQFGILIGCAVIFALMTVISVRRSIQNFEKIDL